MGGGASRLRTHAQNAPRLGGAAERACMYRMRSGSTVSAATTAPSLVSPLKTLETRSATYEAAVVAADELAFADQLQGDRTDVEAVVANTTATGNTLLPPGVNAGSDGASRQVSRGQAASHASSSSTILLGVGGSTSCASGLLADACFGGDVATSPVDVGAGGPAVLPPPPSEILGWRIVRQRTRSVVNLQVDTTTTSSLSPSTAPSSTPHTPLTPMVYTSTSGVELLNVSNGNIAASTDQQPVPFDRAFDTTLPAGWGRRRGSSTSQVHGHPALSLQQQRRRVQSQPQQLAGDMHASPTAAGSTSPVTISPPASRSNSVPVAPVICISADDDLASAVDGLPASPVPSLKPATAAEAGAPVTTSPPAGATRRTVVPSLEFAGLRPLSAARRRKASPPPGSSLPTPPPPLSPVTTDGGESPTPTASTSSTGTPGASSAASLTDDRIDVVWTTSGSLQASDVASQVAEYDARTSPPPSPLPSATVALLPSPAHKHTTLQPLNLAPSPTSALMDKKLRLSGAAHQPLSPMAGLVDPSPAPCGGRMPLNGLRRGSRPAGSPRLRRVTQSELDSLLFSIEGRGGVSAEAVALAMQ